MGKEDMAEVEVTEKDPEVESTGEGKFAVATPDGKSRTKKKKVYTITCSHVLENLKLLVQDPCPCAFAS